MIIKPPDMWDFITSPVLLTQFPTLCLGINNNNNNNNNNNLAYI